MTTGLWPAALAALLGRAGLLLQDHQRGLGLSSSSDGVAGGPWTSALLGGEHVLFYWLSTLLFLILAYVTNPSEASFRVHLTDLSFRLHLKRLQAVEPDHPASSQREIPGEFKVGPSASHRLHSGSNGAINASSKSGSKDGNSTPTTTTSVNHNARANVASGIAGGKEKARKDSNGNSVSASQQQQQQPGSGNKAAPITHVNEQGQRTSKKPASINGDNGRPHVLSFQNRVSISLRTPSYIRTSYGLFSTVRILPVPSPNTAAGALKGRNNGSVAGRGGKMGGRSRKGSVTPSHAGSNFSHSPSSGKGDPRKRNAAQSRPFALVSALARHISSIASHSYWTEQGGFFIGFLGYWWTLDDGTSASGIRERARLANAILAVEEQDDEEVAANEVKQDGRSSRSSVLLEEGITSGNVENVTKLNASSSAGAADTSAVMNGNSAATSTAMNAEPATASSGSGAPTRSKLIQKMASGGSLFRAGQRRSSPTPRLAVAASGKAQAKRTLSGDTTPTSPTGQGTSDPAANRAPNSGKASGTSGGAPAAGQRDTAGSTSGHLDTMTDKNLPGLPFHTSGGALENPTAAQRSGTVAHSSNKGGRSQAGTPGSTDENVESVQKGPNSGHDASARLLGEGADSSASHSASAGAAEIATVTPACALLQNQLDELRATSQATQDKLKGELEDLRARKADEDVVRTELKSRTKALEEVKRQAEQERLESERKLNAARAQKRSIEERVSRVRSELTKLEKRDKEHQAKATRIRAEKEEKLSKLRQEVNERESMLLKETETTDKLASRVEQLELEIDERKGELVHLRDEAAQQARARTQSGVGRGPPPSAHGGGGPGSHTFNRHTHHQPNLHHLYDRSSTGQTGGSLNLLANAGGLHAQAHSNGPFHGYSGGTKSTTTSAVANARGEDHPSRFGGATSAPPGVFSAPSPNLGGAGTSGIQKYDISGPPPGLLDFPTSASGRAYGHQTSLLDQRGQHQSHRRLPGSGSSTGLAHASAAPNPVGSRISHSGSGTPINSSINTSVIGNSATAASALYNRQLRSATYPSAVGHPGGQGVSEDGDALIGSRALGTFAPFGPPGSPDAPGQSHLPSSSLFPAPLNNSSTTARTANTTVSTQPTPPASHVPYFASDTASAQLRHRGGDALFSRGLNSNSGGNSKVSFAEHPATGLDIPAGGHADDFEHGAGEGLERRQSVRRDSASSTSSYMNGMGLGGPLSPMTPHQASLIPSQLFDMLDDMEMPTSPTAGLSSSLGSASDTAHSTFVEGMNRSHPTPAQSLIAPKGSGDVAHPATGSSNQENSANNVSSAVFGSGSRLSSRTGNASPHALHKQTSTGLLGHAAAKSETGWDNLAGLDSDQPSTGFSALARKISHPSGLMSSRFPLSNAGSSDSTAGASASSGTRSTSASEDALSPPLTSPSTLSSAHGTKSPANQSQQQQQQQTMVSHHDLLTRHALSLNPDAKAFSFNRPLPTGASSTNVNGSIGQGRSASAGHPAGANGTGEDAARAAFESGGYTAPYSHFGSNSNSNSSSTSKLGMNANSSTGSSSSLDILSMGGSGGTWASPVPNSRSAVHSLGGGGLLGASHAHAHAQNRTSSGNHGDGSSGSGHTAGVAATSSFSPFDDDDLLRGW